MNFISIPPGMETRAFILEPGALKEVPELLRQYFPEKRPWIVADENTWTAAGQDLFQILTDAGLSPYGSYIFPGSPVLHADEGYVPILKEALPSDSVPIAVGGGTINDLVKRTSGVAGVPYLCVPTAPSVDGYTSYGAAMLVDGRKRTMPCPAPYVLAADCTVLKNAPRPMLASGYADLAAKIPGGADWLMVDSLGLEPVVPDIWQLVQKDLRSWLSEPEDVRGIFMGLAATGYSMQLYRDSRPASGAEHLFSHVWEMEGLKYRGESVSHGFQVGIGSLISVRLMEWVCRTDAGAARKLAAPLLSRAEREKQVRGLLERGCYGSDSYQVAMEKFLDEADMQTRRELIFSRWNLIGQRMRAQLYPFDEFREMLRKAGCPCSYEDIGLSYEQFHHAILTAQLIRKRYTVLDLLFEAGLLEQVAADLKI